MRTAWCWAAVAVAIGCSDAAAPEPPPPAEATRPPTSTVPAGDCDSLGERARQDDTSAAVFVVVCPDTPLDPLQARAAMHSVQDPVTAARLAPRLSEHAELAALARLVALEAIPPLGASQLPQPHEAIVTPIDDDVLAAAQLARTLRFSADVTADARTKARAYLAKVYIRALQSLGSGAREAPPPIARLLAARVLDDGRRFAVAYWRRRVAGLRPLFDVTEDALLRSVQMLEAGPHHADGLATVLEHHRARLWIERDGPRQRIAARVEDTRLRPLANELQRLAEHGFVDLAVDHATDVDGLSRVAALELVVAALVQAERDAAARRLQDRIDRIRTQQPDAIEQGPTPLTVPESPPWPTSDAVAESIATDLVALPDNGFDRRVKLALALVTLQRRPDALRRLVDRLTRNDASAQLRAHTPWIAVLLDAQPHHDRRWLRRRTALDEASPTPVDRDQLETRRRRAFAMSRASEETAED